MQKAIRAVLATFAIMALWAWTPASMALAADITLSPLVGFTFNNPIGIDFQEPGSLIMSVNWPNGLPTNLEKVNISTGVPAGFSTLAGLTDELKVATVRTSPSSPACQQFPVGDVFAGNGQPGEIVRVNAAGVISGPALFNPGVTANTWVKLPRVGANDLLRGSMYVDRACSGFNGDLIVVTGDESVAGGGKVYRVQSNGTATLLANITGAHLEGLITLPVNAKYGPWSGMIVAGNENNNTNSTTDGRIFTVSPAGVVTTYNLSYTDPVTNVHHPLKPEDIDLIEGAFYGVNFGDGRLLTAPASDFATFAAAGDILITQEYPCGGGKPGVTDCTNNGSPTTGLYVVRFVGTGGNAVGGLFRVTELKFSANSTITRIMQWEHVTLAPAADVGVLKTTSTPSINAGGAASFNIVVSAHGPAASFNVMLTDVLPSGTTWTISGADAAPACNATQPFTRAGGATLTCNFGTLNAGTTKTITLSATSAPANCPQIHNVANVSSINDSDSSNNRSSADITVICAQLQTVTQGGWGAPARGNNPGTILNNNFAAINPVVIGSGSAGCFTLTFNSANAVRGFLPQGSTPGSLAASATNPTTSAAGVFGGQVLALKINVAFSNAGVLSAGLGSFVLPSGPAAGKTVIQVLADANAALGCGTLPSYVTNISTLNDIVTSINEMFD